MSCCRNNNMPPKSNQITNFVLSVANAVANAIKTGKVVAPKEVIAKRIGICQNCRYLSVNRCSICGCFVSIKTGVDGEKCPLNHWI